MSPPGVDRLGSKRKLSDEDTMLIKKARTSSRQLITPSAMTADPVSSVPPANAGTSLLAASSITSTPSSKLFSQAFVPAGSARPSSCVTSVLELAKNADGPMIFTSGTIPDDQALTNSALKGAYEMEAAMARLGLSPKSQNSVQSPTSAGINTDPLARATEKQLRKAIDEVAAKLKAHEEAQASWSRPDDDSCTLGEENMPDETLNEKTPDTKEMPNQQSKTGLCKTRAPIKLKLFRKAPQTDDTSMNAIVQGMHEHTLGADEYSSKTIYGSSRGRLLQRQPPELQRSEVYSPHQSDLAIGPKRQKHDRDQRNKHEEDRLSKRGGSKTFRRSESDDRHPMGGMHAALRSTRAGQHAQTASNLEPPRDPNGRHDISNSEFDDLHVSKLDDSDDAMHDDMSNRQHYLASAIANDDGELLGYARPRRRSFEVEAEDYDDWEGYVDADEGEYYGRYEEDEGDEKKEDEEAKFDSKYGWSQPQSDRIRYAPPPRPSFDMPFHPTSSHPEESAGSHVTVSTENNASDEKINEGLAEELQDKARLETVWSPKVKHCPRSSSITGPTRAWLLLFCFPAGKAWISAARGTQKSWASPFGSQDCIKQAVEQKNKGSCSSSWMFELALRTDSLAIRIATSIHWACY